MAHSRALKNMMIEKNKKSANWMQKAFNPETRGALHKVLGVPEGKKIPAGKLEKATHSSNPLTKKRAVLAETARKYK